VKNRHKIFGTGLCITGIVFTPVSYFIIKSIPLTATGISVILIGITSVVLVYRHPSLSSEFYQLMLQTGLENTTVFLEYLGISNKVIYIPSAMGDGHRQALIPLESDIDMIIAKEKIPERFIIKYGQNPQSRAIAITTPGSISIDWFETIPGPTADEIEAAITYILAEVLDIADSASVILVDDRVYVAVSNPKPVFVDTWYCQCMGSPIASIIAAISSEALGKPIKISEESIEKKLNTITLEVLS
jgi:hypothetical protein